MYPITNRLQVGARNEVSTANVCWDLGEIPSNGLLFEGKHCDRDADQNRLRFGELEGVAPLVVFLRSKDLEVVRATATALNQLARIGRYTSTFYSLV